MVKSVSVCMVVITVIFASDELVMTDETREAPSRAFQEILQSKESEIVKISKMYHSQRDRWSAKRETMNSQIKKMDTKLKELKEELQQRTVELGVERVKVDEARRHCGEQYERAEAMNSQVHEMHNELQQRTAQRDAERANVVSMGNDNHRFQQIIESRGQECFGINQQLVQANAEMDRLNSLVMELERCTLVERSQAAAAMAESLQHQQTIQLMRRPMQELQPVQQAYFAHPMPAQQQGEPYMAVPVPPSPPNTPPPATGYNTGFQQDQVQNPFAQYVASRRMH